MDSNGNKKIVGPIFISVLLGEILAIIVCFCICIYVDGLSIRDVSLSDFPFYIAKVGLSLVDKNSVYRIYVLCSFFLLTLLPGMITGSVLVKRYDGSVGKFIILGILFTIPFVLFIIFLPRIVEWILQFFGIMTPDHVYDDWYDIANNMAMVLPRFLSVIKSIAP